MATTLYDKAISDWSRDGSLADLPDGTLGLVKEALGKIQIDDAIVWRSRERLLSMDEAKKSPELFKYFNDQVERDFEEGLQKQIAKYKFDESTVAELKSTPSMVGKTAFLADRVRGSNAQYVELLRRFDELSDSKNAPRQDYDDLLQKRINEAAGAHSLEDRSDNNYKEQINSIREGWQPKRY